VRSVPPLITIKKTITSIRLLLFPRCSSVPSDCSPPSTALLNVSTISPVCSLSPPSATLSPFFQHPPTTALAPSIKSRLSAIHFTLLPYTMSPPSNNVTLAVSASTTTSRASFPTQNDRERSRNAKAQARHRAKRKAYVEQVHTILRSIVSYLHPRSHTPVPPLLA